MVGLSAQLEFLVFLVHLELAAAGDAAAAHAAGHDGRVGGHAAAGGQNALRGLHAFNVLRGGFQADQDHLFTPGRPLLGVLGGEDDLAAGGSRGSAQGVARQFDRVGVVALFPFVGLFQSGRVKLRVQQRVQGPGLDHGDGFLLVDHALVHEVAGNFQRGGGSALAVAGLEHVQLAVLHCELHVLHIVVVVFQGLADVLELAERVGELLGHFGDGHGSADTGDDVLALSVGQELAEQLFLASGGVAGKGDAGAAVVAHVAEGHGLDVDGGAPGIGDVIIPAVNVCAGVIPGTEHGFDRAQELLLGIGGEVLADFLLVLGFELVGKLLQVLRRELHVLGDALLLLHLVNELLEVLLAHLHDDVGVHLNKAAIAVPGPPGVAGLPDEHLDHILVESQIQNGVHHAGHGGPCAGADGDQQRVLEVTELLAGDLLHLRDILHDLGEDIVVDPPAVLVVLGAGFGGDGETLGDGQADVGHFGQVRAFAAQQLTHVRVALGEQVAVLFAHFHSSVFFAFTRQRGLVRQANVCLNAFLL